MAVRRGDTDAGEGRRPSPAEPITLTDPDGAVTLVAPSSTWTREQVRAPGGEPALVTRLDQGQLWFSAGRRRSPWRHEVHIGEAVVSTPAGRFHVTAEPDGGATVACLAGRTRITTGLQEAVVIEADQTAAVSSDGGTIVIVDLPPVDRSPLDAPGPPVAALPQPPPHRLQDPPPEEPQLIEDPDLHLAEVPLVAGATGSRWRRIPEIVAVAALIGVLVAAVLVFGRSTADELETATAVESATTERSTTSPPSSAAPTTATTTPLTTAPAATTAPPTSTAPQAVAPTGAASGELVKCRRAAGGVTATVSLSLTSGGPGRFRVEVGLVDDGGTVFAQGNAVSEVVQGGAPVSVEVPVAFEGAVNGSCEMIGVKAV